MIKDLLENKTGEEKATIKGQEIAKIKSVPKTKIDKYDIEIVDMNAIPHGVEVFARAWDSNGQIGFGKDGTVDIERFVFTNPPILVPDSNGDIVRVYEDGVTRKYKEDLQRALLIDLAHTIDVKTQKFGNENIIQGKVGNTTLTARPAAGANSPVDAPIDKSDASWATAHDASDGDSATPTRASDAPRARFLAGSYYINREIECFDTSSIGTNNINSAVYTKYGNSGTKVDADSTTVDIVASTPAATNNIVVGDYDQLGTTVFATVTIASWDATDGNANNFTLDANGIANISKTGVSKFGVRIGRDTANSAPTGDNSVQTYQADQAGTTVDPTLVVEHSAATASHNFGTLGVGS